MKSVRTIVKSPIINVKYVSDFQRGVCEITSIVVLDPSFFLDEKRRIVISLCNREMRESKLVIYCEGEEEGMKEEREIVIEKGDRILCIKYNVFLETLDCVTEENKLISFQIPLFEKVLDYCFLRERSYIRYSRYYNRNEDCDANLVENFVIVDERNFIVLNSSTYLTVAIRKKDNEEAKEAKKFRHSTKYNDILLCFCVLKTNSRMMITAGGTKEKETTKNINTSLKCWNWKEEIIIKSFRKKHRFNVVALTSFLKGEKEFIVSCSFSGEIILWDTTGRYVRTINTSSVKPHLQSLFRGEGIFSILNFDMNYFLVGGEFGTLDLINTLNNVSVLNENQEVHKSIIRRMEWMDKREKKEFYTIAKDGSAKIFKFEDLRKLDEDRERLLLFFDNENCYVGEFKIKLGYSSELLIPPILFYICRK